MLNQGRNINTNRRRVRIKKRKEVFDKAKEYYWNINFGLSLYLAPTHKEIKQNKHTTRDTHAKEREERRKKEEEEEGDLVRSGHNCKLHFSHSFLTLFPFLVGFSFALQCSCRSLLHLTLLRPTVERFICHFHSLLLLSVISDVGFSFLWSFFWFVDFYTRQCWLAPQNLFFFHRQQWPFSFSKWGYEYCLKSGIRFPFYFSMFLFLYFKGSHFFGWFLHLPGLCNFFFFSKALIFRFLCWLLTLVTGEFSSSN